MVSEINQTPRALRVHIGVFGDTNAGKSTLINAVSGQKIALTSPVAGTTTDPIFKPMELLPIGPVVFIDTAGLDDTSELGNIRVKKSLEQLDICDGAIVVVNSENYNKEHTEKYIKLISEKKIPFLIVVNEQNNNNKSNIEFKNQTTIHADLHNKDDVYKVKESLIAIFDKRENEPVLTSDLVKAGDTVILVMPQDIQAPKGRLILPQVQVIRDLLDNKCVVISVTPENLDATISNLKKSPDLVITDSQIFKTVDEKIPKNIRLTSFSVLMAKIKGNLNEFVNAAKVIDKLEDGDKVLILESCSHHALDDDIARVKIPNLLKKYTNKNITIDNYSGQNIDINLQEYKLAIHCGGCMINRKAMISKQNLFAENGVPLTNFGICIAYMNGILERVCY